MNIIILLALGLGLVAWFFHLVFIVKSLRSRKRWTLYLDYNTKHEGVIELLLFLFCIIITLIAMVILYD